jgi:hypothetical protein
MPIPDFPYPTDDSGESDDGTPIDLEWTEDLHDAIEAVVYGEDNPTVAAAEIIDDVVEARDGEASLDDRINRDIFGEDNPAIGASVIIDEVIEARDDNPDLNDRLDNFVTDEIPDADGSTRGLVSTGAQTIAGAKTFSGNASFGGTVGITGVLTLAAMPVGKIHSATSGDYGIRSRRLSATEGVVTVSATAEGTVLEITLPANAFGAIGDSLRAYVTVTAATGGNAKTNRLYVGSTSVTIGSGTGTGIATATVVVTRISADTVGIAIIGGSGLLNGTAYQTIGSLDFATALTFKITAQVATSGSISFLAQFDAI